MRFVFAWVYLLTLGTTSSATKNAGDDGAANILVGNALPKTKDDCTEVGNCDTHIRTRRDLNRDSSCNSHTDCDGLRLCTAAGFCHDLTQLTRCNNGALIGQWEVCDGIQNCLNGEDETGCPTSVTTTTTEQVQIWSTTCDSDDVMCSSGRCIHNSFVCDGDDDCESGEDELGCTSPTTTTASVKNNTDWFGRFGSSNGTTIMNKVTTKKSAMWQTADGRLVEVYFDCNSTCQEIVRITDYEDYIFFYIYTRNHPEGYPIRPGNIANLDKFIRGADVKIHCHGFWSNYSDGIGPTLTNAYFENTDKNVNVIGIDWSGLASTWYYKWAVEYTKDVASYTANLIEFLQRSKIANPGQIHCIGHSLGAHLCGLVNNYLKPKGIPRIRRITGLDPAGPRYEELDDSDNITPIHPDDRLSNDDADFVDVIHTDPGRWGILYAIGDVDYFPNGDSSRQPGCSWPDIVCSHSIVYKHFAESIRDPFAFFGCVIQDIPNKWAYPPPDRTLDCMQADMLVMGNSVKERTPDGVPQIVYSKTWAEAPYGCRTRVNCDKRCDTGSVFSSGYGSTTSLFPNQSPRANWRNESDAHGTIVGGRDAALGEFPWAISLIIPYGSKCGHFCGGVLVKPNVVLTAAHCIQEIMIRYVLVMAGRHLLSDVNGQEQTRRVVDYRIHEDYWTDGNNRLANDLAVITTDQPFVISERLRTANLWTLQPGHLNNLVTIAGWGQTSAQNPLPSNTLLRVDVPLLPSCAPFYGTPHSGWVCAGTMVSGSCMGDSGGPLHESSGFVVGTVSFGRETCDAPAVFMDFRYYQVWIDSAVHNCGTN